MYMTLYGVAGIDEAGRGPMFGPMVICGVLLDVGALEYLESEGVRDSKILSPKRRESLAGIIREVVNKESITTILANEIDRSRSEKKNLNEIEVEAFASTAKILSPAVLYLDAADVNAERFGESVGRLSGLLEKGCDIHSEHKADEKYIVVGAASILAKVERDQHIEDLHEKYGDFGSGYPSDPKSIKYLQDLLSEEKELPEFIRRSWKSVSKRVQQADSTQSTLNL
jgi:ribonuclease HII